MGVYAGNFPVARLPPGPGKIFARCAVFGRFCKHDSSSMKNNSAAAGLLCLWLYAGCAIQRAGPQKNSALPEKFSGATPLEWSQRLADSEIARRGDSLAWQPGGKAKWDYTAGLFTLALLK